MDGNTLHDASTRNDSATAHTDTGNTRGICSADVPSLADKFAEGLDILVHAAMGHGMHLSEMREALLKEAAWCAGELTKLDAA